MWTSQQQPHGRSSEKHLCGKRGLVGWMCHCCKLMVDCLEKLFYLFHVIDSFCRWNILLFKLFRSLNITHLSSSSIKSVFPVFFFYFNKSATNYPGNKFCSVIVDSLTVLEKKRRIFGANVSLLQFVFAPLDGAKTISTYWKCLLNLF